jgi:hypothetical protein
MKEKKYSNRHDRIREARQLFDIYDVLGLSERKRVIVCPLPMHPHHNNTPSFSIYTDKGVQKFHCHGSCGRMGDIIDLVGFMNIAGYNDRDHDHVARALTILETGYKVCPPRKAPRAPALVNTVWQDFLPPRAEVIEYAATRGLTPETLRKFGFGQSDMYNKVWMTMPCFHMGRLMGVKMRNLNATSSRDRYMSLPGSIGGLFNLNSVYYNTGPLLIVKAEIPAALMDQYGIPACAPTGGESSNEAELYSLSVWARKRIVVADNDHDPKVRAKMDEFAMKRAQTFHAELRRPPEAFKDLDEWVLAKPEEAIPEIKRWME